MNNEFKAVIQQIELDMVTGRYTMTIGVGHTQITTETNQACLEHLIRTCDRLGKPIIYSLPDIHKKFDYKVYWIFE